nr:MAG TPA: hypothetical protein [Caudoviricetes sp.]
MDILYVMSVIFKELQMFVGLNSGDGSLFLNK